MRVQAYEYEIAKIKVNLNDISLTKDCHLRLSMLKSKTSSHALRLPSSLRLILNTHYLQQTRRRVVCQPPLPLHRTPTTTYHTTLCRLLPRTALLTPSTELPLIKALTLYLCMPTANTGPQKSDSLFFIPRDDAYPHSILSSLITCLRNIFLRANVLC